MATKSYSNGTRNGTKISVMITGSASVFAIFQSGFSALEESAMDAPDWIAAGSVLRLDDGFCGPVVLPRISFRGE